MNTLSKMILIASVALIAGCEKKGGLGHSARPVPSVHVTGRTPNQWSMNYTAGEQDAISLWTGKGDTAVYILVPAGTGSATLTATEKGLVLEVGGSRVGPMPSEAFAFSSESESVETDGSIIIGQCSAGPVGIRIAKEPTSRIIQPLGAVLLTCFPEITTLVP